MAKKKETTVIKDPMTTIIEAKREYSDEEKIEFGKQIADAMGEIAEKEARLKEFAKNIKDDVTSLETIMAKNAAAIRQGYEMTSVMCYVTYEDDKKTAVFTDKDSGEIVERRELTQEEQLRLNSQWRDAEEIIREDSKEN